MCLEQELKVKTEKMQQTGVDKVEFDQKANLMKRQLVQNNERKEELIERKAGYLLKKGKVEDFDVDLLEEYKSVEKTELHSLLDSARRQLGPNKYTSMDKFLFNKLDDVQAKHSQYLERLV